ncbi:MAG: hemerythrin domain-containing protein [Lentisphaeria bacterium]
MTLEREAVKTNITLIDHQHEKYFDAVDKLMEQCRKKYPDMEIVAQILQQTHEYAVDNFDTEEYLMELEGYPDSEEHTEKHNQFKARLDAFTRQLQTEKLNIRDTSKHLQALLIGWFNNQIKEDDMRMAAFLHTREKGR